MHTADPADVDPVLAAARGVESSSDGVEIGLPAAPGEAWTVTEVDRAFPTAVDAAAVDPVTFAVIDKVRFAEFPFMAKLARWGVELHMVTLFGLATVLAQDCVVNPADRGAVGQPSGLVPQPCHKHRSNRVVSGQQGAAALRHGSRFDAVLSKRNGHMNWSVRGAGDGN